MLFWDYLEKRKIRNANMEWQFLTDDMINRLAPELFFF